MDIQTKTICNRAVENLISRYPQLGSSRDRIIDAAVLLVERILNGGRILLCGNGGSAADVDHIVGELGKSFTVPRSLPPEISEKLEKIDPERGRFLAEALQPGIPAIALTHHAALSTAFSNDVEPAAVFAQQTLVYGRPGDVLWAISTSGDAESVLLAAITARAQNMAVVGLTGASGGMLADYCDVCIRVPEEETYKVQELHLPVYHQLCIILEQRLFST